MKPKRLFFFFSFCVGTSAKKKLNYNNNKKALPISAFSSLCTKKKLNLNWNKNYHFVCVYRVRFFFRSSRKVCNPFQWRKVSAANPLRGIRQNCRCHHHSWLWARWVASHTYKEKKEKFKNWKLEKDKVSTKKKKMILFAYFLLLLWREGEIRQGRLFTLSFR